MLMVLNPYLLFCLIAVIHGHLSLDILYLILEYILNIITWSM